MYFASGFWNSDFVTLCLKNEIRIILMLNLNSLPLWLVVVMVYPNVIYEAIIPMDVKLGDVYADVGIFFTDK